MTRVSLDSSETVRDARLGTLEVLNEIFSGPNQEARNAICPITLQRHQYDGVDVGAPQRSPNPAHIEYAEQGWRRWHALLFRDAGHLCNPQIVQGYDRPGSGI
jgi:hypothetical protein